MEMGHEVAGMMYSAIQKLVDQWLLIEGHSVGIQDTIADPETYKDIQNTITEAKVNMVSFVAVALFWFHFCRKSI